MPSLGSRFGRYLPCRDVADPKLEVAQVAQIFGGVNTLSGYVRPESVSAEFSTTASEP